MPKRVIFTFLCLLFLSIRCVPRTPTNVSPTMPPTLVATAASPPPTHTIPPTTVPTPTPLATKLALDLRDIIGRQGTVLYIQREAERFALRAWPASPIFDQPPLPAFYGETLGPLYTKALAPQLNANGRYLVIPSLDGDNTPNQSLTWLVDLESGEIEALAGHPPSAVWSPDGQTLAYVVEETLYLYKVGHNQDASPIFTQAGLSDFFLAWSPDSQQIAVLSQGIEEGDGEAPPQIGHTLWVVTAERPTARQLGQLTIVPIAHPRRALQWSPAGTEILVGLTAPQQLLAVAANQATPLKDGVNGLAWVGNDLLIKEGATLALLDPNTPEEVIPITSFEQPLSAWALSANGRYLAYADPQGIHLFDFASSTAKATLIVPFAPIATLHWVSGTHDLLIADDGDWQTPLWAVSLNGQVEMLVEQGVLSTYIQPVNAPSSNELQNGRVYVSNTNERTVSVFGYDE